MKPQQPRYLDITLTGERDFSELGFGLFFAKLICPGVACFSEAAKKTGFALPVQ